jgi:hypothetical protein
VTTYQTIIIDTYDPANPGVPAAYATYMELWTKDGTMLASQDGGAPNARPTSPLVSLFFPYINYTAQPTAVTPIPPLASGDYYVLVKFSSSASPNVPLNYAIRVLTAWTDYTSADWVTGLTPIGLSSDQPTAGALIPTTNFPPYNYPTITYTGTTSDKLERTLAIGGVNWVHIHLP